MHSPPEAPVEPLVGGEPARPLDDAIRSCPGEHRILEVHEYEWLIYSDLMGKVKIALGQTSRVEALWSS